MPGMKILRWPVFALFALLLAACGHMPQKKVDMVAEYGVSVRWSDWDSAWNFIDPATRSSPNLPEDEQERLKDVKVTGYEVHMTQAQPDGTMKQIVEIRYIEQATQVEKSFRDTQIWRTDDKGEHWWLTTGLPHF
jgi:hypothetical protein